MTSSSSSFVTKINYYVNDFKTSFSECTASKGIIFGTLAIVFEWYDFALFGYFATLIGKQFFPSSDPLTAILSSFAVFASGFAMRPLGAILFGYIGDRMGRKKAMITSLMMMALPTMALGFLPNYASIGIASSVGLVLIRLCQGLAVGGNYGGSCAFTIEHAKVNHKGLAGSLTEVGAMGGLLIGSGIATLLGYILTEDHLQNFGWRIPFILGGVSAFFGYYMRNHLPEINVQENESSHQIPLKIVWNNYLGNILKTIGIILFDGVGVYILFVFMTTYASTFLHIPQHKAFLVNTISMTVLVGSIPFFGWLGDQLSQRVILKWVSFSFIFLSLPLFAWLIYNPSILSLLLLQGIFSVVVGAVYGTLPTMVATAFPRSVRYTASGLAFNVSVAVFGGTSPFVVAELIHLTGWLIVPAIILTIIGVIGYFSLFKLKNTYE